ncbi:hypothetical protein CNMCM5793_001655 [Aspergillus hiratsukae]|uniref:Chromo domain-containing protein n=1 Tax=Aspergillus hiratsukae TaxID=1194566 RepID=A0A8H6UMA4_9EURO|nr:hypothetical protein CNMCM5793_001655 [Aspergillus hiratsukae]KAF7156560.1 hypothetical protein CNMCM6106_000592 [Aspergillus hiratsukae]
MSKGLCIQSGHARTSPKSNWSQLMYGITLPAPSALGLRGAGKVQSFEARIEAAEALKLAGLAMKRQTITVLQRIGPLAYKLDLPETWRIHPVISVEHLEQYPPDQDPSGRPAPDKPGPIQVEGQGEYEIEKIIAKRYHKTKSGRIKAQYLVKWLGYDDHENTRLDEKQFDLRKSSFKDIDFWASPNMLGFLLGLLGPAPAGATKRNFYLRLTAMFGKWCQRLCSARLPTVVQCPWSTADGRYCLGASMSGHDAEKRTTGSWLAVLNRARFSVIRNERFRLSGWSQAWSELETPRDDG